MRRARICSWLFACLTALSSACSRPDEHYHSEWLDPLATQDGGILFIEHSRAIVGLWSPETREARLLSQSHVAPHAAVLLRAADGSREDALILADGRKSSPTLGLQPLTGSAAKPEVLTHAFDRLSAASEAPFAVAFNDPRFASPRRGLPGTLAFACAEAGRLHFQEIAAGAPEEGAAEDAGAFASDFPLAIEWGTESSHSDEAHAFVADSLRMRIFRLRCPAGAAPERPQLIDDERVIDLTNIDAKASFEVTDLQVRHAEGRWHAFAASRGADTLLHVHFQEGERLQIQRITTSAPIATLKVSDAGPVVAAVLTNPAPDQGRIELYRTGGEAPIRTDLGHPFDSLITDASGPCGKVQTDGMIIAAGGGDGRYLAAIAAGGLLERRDALTEGSGVIRLFELPHPVLQTVRLADAVWALHGEGGATVIDLGSRMARPYHVGEATARQLPLTEPIAADLPVQVGCTGSGKDAPVLWFLDPQRRRIVSITTSSRQQRAAALPAEALQLLALGDGRAVAIHESTFGRATSVQIGQHDQRHTQVDLRSSEGRYLFAPAFGGQR